MKTGPAKYLKQVENHDVYQKFAAFVNSNNEEIRLLWGLHKKVREKRPKQRLMKVVLNPARHTTEEIREFFAWLKNVIGQEGKPLLEVANVTRLDIAMDIHGVPIQYLLIDRPNVKKRGFHANIKSKKGLVGTQMMGSFKSSGTRAYNKVRKYRDAGPYYVDLLVYNDDRYLPVSRVERVLRPADTVSVMLGELEKAPYFLKGTEFYQPKHLADVTKTDKESIEQYGFAYWYHALNQKRWRKFKAVQRDKYVLNDQLLKDHQDSVLSVLKSIIIDA